jgi:hypothetical protein
LTAVNRLPGRFFSDRQIAPKTLKRSLSRVKLPRSAIRLKGYLRAVFDSGLSSWEFDFGRIMRRTGMSRRTIERALAWLRENDADFKFLTRRVGRSYAVRVSDRQKRPPFPPHPLSPHGNSFGIDRNTAGRISAKAANPKLQASREINRLAGFVARRDLAALHWDNCKVHFRFAHAFNFAAAALARGFDRRAIVRAYEAALLRRHRDATDLGLNRGDPATVRFEPSSTVTLAKELLGDGLTDAVRVRHRLVLLAPQKAENARLAAELRADLTATLAEPFSP